MVHPLVHIIKQIQKAQDIKKRKLEHNAINHIREEIKKYMVDLMLSYLTTKD